MTMSSNLFTSKYLENSNRPPQKKRITFFPNNFDIYDRHTKKCKQVKLQDVFSKYRKSKDELNYKTLVKKFMSINLKSTDILFRVPFIFVLYQLFYVIIFFFLNGGCHYLCSYLYPCLAIDHRL